MSGKELLALLREAASGASISETAVQDVELDDVQPETKELANEAWHHLMHYAHDEDIRSRDKEYAKDQMETAGQFEERLRALIG